jgi:hypothetical protein
MSAEYNNLVELNPSLKLESNLKDLNTQFKD